MEFGGKQLLFLAELEKSGAYLVMLLHLSTCVFLCKQIGGMRSSEKAMAALEVNLICIFGLS